VALTSLTCLLPLTVKRRNATETTLDVYATMWRFAGIVSHDLS